MIFGRGSWRCLLNVVVFGGGLLGLVCFFSSFLFSVECFVVFGCFWTFLFCYVRIDDVM